MRMEMRNGKIEVTLSRKNILTLLAKLDGNPPDSACTIVGGDGAIGLIMRAEEDDVHYAELGRPAGIMHPDTEDAIR